MNFNIDDPLAGILSDGSDDSFFDDDILGKKKPQKKPETPVAIKKNAIFNLQDTQTRESKITEENVLTGDKTLKKDSLGDIKDRGDFLNTTSKPINQPLRKGSLHQRNDSQVKLLSERTEFISKSPAKSKLSTNATDKLNFNNHSGNTMKEPIKTTDKGKSSQALLDDILGTPTMKANQPTKSPTVKKRDFDVDFILGSDSNNLTSNKIVSQKSSTQFENTQESSSNQAKKSKTNEDWLGIFQNDEATDVEDNDDVPAWLGGGSNKKKKVKEPTKPEPEPLQRPASEEPTPKKESLEEPQIKMALPRIEDQGLKTLNLESLETKEDLTMGGAALYLQQQESQLMVALQLKAQEEKLAAIQMRQKESQKVQRVAALAQHEQLDAMLRRQTENRLQMQAIINAHQERIAQRIKALLGDTHLEYEEVPIGIGDYQELEKKDSPFAKEKMQLLQLVQSLQENHDKEIDLMETSYRRQLAFLEVSFVQAEERMKDEGDKLVKFYTEKISWLNEHHLLYKKMSEENMCAITERHKSENDMLREQHLDNIKILQEHHAALMENVKNAVKQEQTLIKDSANFSLDLQQLLFNVKDGNDKCSLLYEKVESLCQSTQKDTDRSMQIRETQISDMLEHLKRDKENFEKEKLESKDMVNMLEARLKQMTSMIEEESTTLRQKKMEFEFEKATFNKQTEFAKNILKKQDEEIKMLREDIQKDYQEKKSRSEEERAKAVKDSALIAKEKASVQSLKMELEKTKAELHAQLEEIAEERSKLNAEKQELHIEEQRVMSKSRDLDMLAKTAMERQSQADKKASEAEFLQKKYEDRIRRIQEHVVSLNNREKQIAKEKVSLSRERLSLHNERKESEGKQCSLCRSPQITNSYYQPAMQYPVSRDYGVYNSMANVETEIDHLMGIEKEDRETVQVKEASSFKEYMDPKFMMLRLDVQQVINNLGHADHTTRDEVNRNEQE